MQNPTIRIFGPVALTATLMTAGMALAHGTDDHSHDHDHAQHDQQAIAKGYFDDSQVQQRELSDWAGDWQSVYPYLTDGTLQPVMEHKAAHGDKSAQDYRAYYDTGYQTDVTRIEIKGPTVVFHRDKGVVQADYANNGQEILTYEKGNRGVRYVFEKTGGDQAAPRFIQFSDHAIAPQKADHYHLYWGDDRAAVLQELTNWPTFYPSSLTGPQIVEEMIAH